VGVTGEWADLCNVELLCSSPDTEVDKRGQECSIHEYKKDVCKTLVVKTEGKSRCGRRRA
jgi:hypothetical protein